jgi:opacity protein-like surface antigen
MKFTKILLAISVSALSLSAQSFSLFNRPIQFNAGGGFTNGLYSTGKRTDTGYNFAGGVTFNIKMFGIRAEYQFNDLGINPATTNSLGFPGGHIKMHSVTLNPTLDIPIPGPVHFYVIGGAGWYQRTTKFDAPTTPYFQAVDPYFNLYYPSPVPSYTVDGSFTQNKLGLNGGAGIRFKMWGRTKAYAEWRYNHVYTSPKSTTYAPVTLGIEF